MRRPVIGSERLFRGTREQRLRRFKMIPVRFLLPNIITLLALCSGVTAIKLGIEGRYELAVGAVILAVVLDAIDGRLARLLKGSSRFGAELDSLADFVNFGVAPAILVYVWSLHQLRNLGWIVALGLAICCALRLARFNVAIDDPDKPAWKMNFFVGIPAPAGAGLAMAPMYLGFLGLVPDGKAAAALVLVWVALVAAGMVSRVPTFSGKTLGQRVHRDLVPPIIAAAVLTLIMLIAFTWEAVSIIAFTYVAFIPFGISSYRRQERAFAERVATPGDLPS
ncbi:MAG TPA: phosphatidylcholine/phosphatidylserine synthase [Aestuariivirgaceae bacterium]|nr:phosphatidylcholine/phosphatidylserine synthase [Aestuariivirgaceae bacterium]